MPITDPNRFLIKSNSYTIKLNGNMCNLLKTILLLIFYSMSQITNF